MINVLTIDVEEYFHPTEVQNSVGDCASWTRLPSRIESQTALILDLLAECRVKGTFFVLGWVAYRKPGLIRKIAEAGHEIGCHSYAHKLVYAQSRAEFTSDLNAAMKAIADACGIRPTVYRAPSYSITQRSLWALEILVEHGFTHDSSIFPINHDRYGIPGFSRHACVVTTPAGPIREIPIAAVRLSRTRVAPVGGGGYLRLLPYCYTAAGIRRINSEDSQPACIYFHPWELDAGQPRLASGFVAQLRTYTGIGGMRTKISRLLKDFRFDTVSAIHPVVEEILPAEFEETQALGPFRTLSMPRTAPALPRIEVRS